MLQILKEAFTVSTEIQNLGAQTTFSSVTQGTFGIHIQNTCDC